MKITLPYALWEKNTKPKNWNYCHLIPFYCRENATASRYLGVALLLSAQFIASASLFLVKNKHLSSWGGSWSSPLWSTAIEVCRNFQGSFSDTCEKNLNLRTLRAIELKEASAAIESDFLFSAKIQNTGSPGDQSMFEITADFPRAI